MAYTSKNFRTKKDLKAAVVEAEKGSLMAQRGLQVWSPGPFPVKQDGEDVISGPQYPEPHRWYARVRIVDGYVAKVLS